MVKIGITDNRTSLNTAGNAADWTSDKSPANNTIEFFEGGDSVSDQASNVVFEIYDTITSVDLSDVTMFQLYKDALHNTLANNGIQFIMGDGTDRGGYPTGGSDNPLFPLNNYWAMNRLDTTVLGTPVNQAGDGVPNFAAITQAGYGCLHAQKAVGSIDNFYIDELSYIANGSRAVEIIGGSSGTPETFDDIIGDDETAGIGLFNNPKGKEYGIYGSVGWGDNGGTESYFDDSDAQIFIDGRNMGADDIDQVMLGSANTQSFVLDNCVIINLLTSDTGVAGKANWDCDDANHDILKITGCTFQGCGDFLFPTIDNSNKFVTDSIFINCELITASTMLFEGNTIKVPLSQGVLISSDSAQIDDCTFDLTGGSGTKDSLVIDTPGTYNLDGVNFFGGGGTLYDINNTSAGAVTVNITNSSNPPTEANSRNTGGGSLSIVTGTVSTTITVKTTDSPPIAIENARVLVWVTNNDNYFYQASITITGSGTTATVAHTAHGLSTGEYVWIEGANEDYYNGQYQITVTGVNEYTYTATETLSISPATGTITSTFVVLSGLTNASGIISDSRSWSLNQAISGWAAKSTSTPFYKRSGITGTIDNGSGYAQTLQMILDE